MEGAHTYCSLNGKYTGLLAPPTAHTHGQLGVNTTLHYCRIPPPSPTGTHTGPWQAAVCRLPHHSDAQVTTANNPVLCCCCVAHDA
mmetsp:Transcript_4047/g.7212  ORF Transcript_4047/g.7212 Transcript_4047/m.7212 type:complete len:86 (+) Transcript_4047:353-610(+)